MLASPQHNSALETAPQPLADAPTGAAILARTPDDKAMLRAAVELTRDLGEAKPSIFWPDMLASALTGYAALAGAILAANMWVAIACGVTFGRWLNEPNVTWPAAARTALSQRTWCLMGNSKRMLMDGI